HPGRRPGAHAHPGQRRRVRSLRHWAGRPPRARALCDRRQSCYGMAYQYATARFGNLDAGTGLLLDMGRPAAIIVAWVTLGPAHGASFQLRVGTAPALA